MYEWTKKIHMYAGLLTFTAFVVWGFAGVHAVFLPSPGGYQPPEISEVEERPFQAPGDLDDRELARLIYETMDLSLSGGHYNTRRNEEDNLAFIAFTWNGRRDLTYLEEQQTVRIEYRDNSTAGFLSSMHTAHSRRGPVETPVRLWGYFNELATWAFFFMSLSGVYMWIATRPGLPWARICFGGAAAVSVILWFVTR